MADIYKIINLNLSRNLWRNYLISVRYKNNLLSIIYVRWLLIFVHFVERSIHQFKNNLSSYYFRKLKAHSSKNPRKCHVFEEHEIMPKINTGFTVYNHIFDLARMDLTCTLFTISCTLWWFQYSRKARASWQKKRTFILFQRHSYILVWGQCTKSTYTLAQTGRRP